MKNFYKKYKNQISIIAFIVLALPLFYFITTLLLASIVDRADKVQEKIIDNSLEKQKIAKIPQMEKTNDEFEKNKEVTGTILDASANVEFIKYLEDLADNTGNAIAIQMRDNKDAIKKPVVNSDDSTTTAANKSKEPEKSLEEKLVYRNYISMQVNLTGNYAELLNFIHKLENSQDYVNIVSLTVKKDVEDNTNSGSIGSAENLKVGDIFQAPQNSNQTAANPEVAKKVLKSSLAIVVYTQ